MYAIQELKIVSWDVLSVDMCLKILREIDPDFNGFLALPVLTKIIARLPRESVFYQRNVENSGTTGHAASGEGYMGDGRSASRPQTAGAVNARRKAARVKKGLEEEAVKKRFRPRSSSGAYGRKTRNLCFGTSSGSTFAPCRETAARPATARECRKNDVSVADLVTAEEIQNWTAFQLVRESNLAAVNGQGAGSALNMPYTLGGSRAMTAVRGSVCQDPRAEGALNPHTVLNWDKKGGEKMNPEFAAVARGIGAEARKKECDGFFESPNKKDSLMLRENRELDLERAVHPLGLTRDEAADQAEAERRREEDSIDKAIENGYRNLEQKVIAMGERRFGGLTDGEELKPPTMEEIPAVFFTKKQVGGEKKAAPLGVRGEGAPPSMKEVGLLEPGWRGFIADENINPDKFSPRPQSRIGSPKCSENGKTLSRVDELLLGDVSNREEGQSLGRTDRRLDFMRGLTSLAEDSGGGGDNLELGYSNKTNIKIGGLGIQNASSSFGRDVQRTMQEGMRRVGEGEERDKKFSSLASLKEKNDKERPPGGYGDQTFIRAGDRYFIREEQEGGQRNI